jgi:hypothetical protein
MIDAIILLLVSIVVLFLVLAASAYFIMEPLYHELHDQPTQEKEEP